MKITHIRTEGIYSEFAVPEESVIVSCVWQRCRSRQGVGTLIVRKNRNGIGHALIGSCWHREDGGELPRSREYYVIGSENVLGFL